MSKEVIKAIKWSCIFALDNAYGYRGLLPENIKVVQIGKKMFGRLSLHDRPFKIICKYGIFYLAVTDLALRNLVHTKFRDPGVANNILDSPNWYDELEAIFGELTHYRGNTFYSEPSAHGRIFKKG